MYDIVVNRNGSYRISSGDLTNCERSLFLSQKIHRALMLMPTESLRAPRGDSYDAIAGPVTAYLAAYFASDPDVIPAGLSIGIERTAEQRTTLTISYRDTGDNAIEVNSVLNHTAGTMTNIDFEPVHLSVRISPTYITVCYRIHIDDYTSLVELPVEPHFDAGDIILRDLTSTGAVVYTTLTVSIALTANFRSVVSHFLATADYIPGVHSLVSVSTEDAVTIIWEYGEAVAVAAEDLTAIFTVVIATALQTSDTMVVQDVHSNAHPFPLRPTRGRYMALFPKSIAPGDYLLEYTGIVEGI